MPQIVPCPVCSEEMDVDSVGIHLDRDCHKSNEIQPSLPLTATDDSSPTKAVTPLASIFTPRSRKPSDSHLTASYRLSPSLSSANKRSISAASTSAGSSGANAMGHSNQGPSPSKRLKQGTTAVRDAMPLAEKMRPTTLDGIYGQEDVINLLRSMVSSSRLPSMIFSGGPGCGKTTLARALAKEADCRFLEISGTTSGVKECNQVFEEARGLLTMTGKKTVVFCDEIHRLNTGQQDIFLAPVERGEVTLIGATTENPAFRINNALLSRCRVLTLTPLSQSHIEVIVTRALRSESPKDPTTGVTIIPALFEDGTFIAYLARLANGDARIALNLLSQTLPLALEAGVTEAQVKKTLSTNILYDRSGSLHYDHISALHKSIRGSDPSAAIFWLLRMLDAGEDPLYIARRMVVMASEDIGLADNSMLSLATAAYTAVQIVGMPEARINLVHCAAALAEAKKSTRSYRGMGRAINFLKDPACRGAPVPPHLRDPGDGTYKYNPDYLHGQVKQDYMPLGHESVTFLDNIDLGTMVDPDLEDVVTGAGRPRKLADFL